MSRVGGSQELVRGRIEDGATRPLTDTPEREESWPYWSEAAGRLVFQVAPAGSRGQSDLVLWDPQRGEQPLTRTPRREERWPEWSPQGERLVYAFRGGRPAAGLMIVNPNASRGALLAESQGKQVYLRPSFSPDGRRLVVQRRGPDGHGSNLWLLEAPGPPRPLLTDAEWFDFKAWFTRDGSAIVFSRHPVAGGPGELMRVDPDGGNLRAITREPLADDHSGRPSPTRDELVFVSDRSGTWGVYLADLAGGNLRLLADSPEYDEMAPRWSPDGERIVVTLSPADEGDPRLTDPESLDASGIQVLDREGEVLFEAPGFMPSWMPPWR